MDELNLRVVITNDPGSLEQVLHSSSEGGLLVKSFTAEHKPERNHYEVTLCIAGCMSPHQIINKLAQHEHIRELTPIKPGRML